MQLAKWQVKKYMAQIADEYVDPQTGEVNSTKIAEDACKHFDAYEPDDSIPEDFFDWAVVVAENHEALYQTVDAAGLP